MVAGHAACRPYQLYGFFWLWITKMSNFVILAHVSPTKSSEAETLPLIGPIPS
jgi:hypothetical protein